MKKKILENTSFIVGIVTILGIFFFRNSLSNAAIIGSIGVIVYGLVSCLNSNRLGVLFISIGSSLLSAMSIYRADILPKFETITFFICMSMILLVIIATIFEILNVKSMLKVHSLKVDAEVIDLVKNPNTKKDYYQPIYEYIIGKDLFTVGLPGYLEKSIPKIGDKIKIHVNPDDPEDVYFEKKKSENIHMILVGLFFLIASILIIVSLF